MPKPLKGCKGAGVLEIVSDFDGDTFRAVYTVKITGIIYVLHAFQKKSKKGIKTPQVSEAKTKEEARLELEMSELIQDPQYRIQTNRSCPHKQPAGRIRAHRARSSCLPEFR